MQGTRASRGLSYTRCTQNDFKPHGLHGQGFSCKPVSRMRVVTTSEECACEILSKVWDSPLALCALRRESFCGNIPLTMVSSVTWHPPQVIATPYSTNFDHLRIADEAQFKYDRALRALGPDASMLPSYGVGHSLGCAIHMLICTRYAVKVRLVIEAWPVHVRLQPAICPSCAAVANAHMKQLLVHLLPRAA